MQDTILHAVLCFIWHGMADLGFSLRLRATELNSHLTWQRFKNQRSSPLSPSTVRELQAFQLRQKSKPINALAQLLSSLKDFNWGPEITLGTFPGRWHSQGSVSGPRAAATLG